MMLYAVILIISLYVLYGSEVLICEKLLWLPWLNFWGDNWILQLCLIALLYYLFAAINPYATLFYLFLLVIAAGFYLSLLQVELFTAFLWVIELTVILVCILILFYLNISGTLSILSLNKYVDYKLACFIATLAYFLFIPSEVNSELYFNNVFYFYNVWNNYYEAAHLNTANDLLSLTLSYYTLNNLELILMGFLLLVGSIICVNINKQQRYSRNTKVSSDMSILNIYNYLINSIFLRRQNMTAQGLARQSLHVFKKKRGKKAAIK